MVDSTATSEALGDAAAAALWSAHDRCARDLLPAWRGREIDKTDGMLLLFDEAADALGYASGYNQAIRTLPVPLTSRAGLHVGDVTCAKTAPPTSRSAPSRSRSTALPSRPPAASCRWPGADRSC